MPPVLTYPARRPKNALLLPPFSRPAPSPAYVLERVLEADRALVDVDAGAPGHMLFSRTFFPAWKGRLDGSPAPVLLANGRDLAVAVPPGKHRLEIFWSPTSFRRGFVLQGLALLAALGALLAGFAPRRQRNRMTKTVPAAP